MANPQKEDGYTPIANEILEALCKTDIVIAYYEMKCLHFILRKTYGWQKKEDRISLSQFVEGTNIKRPHVCRALKRLLAGNFITQSGNHKSVTYSFQKNYRKWTSLPKRVTITQRGNDSLPNGVIQVVPNGGHTKETITKEKKENVRRFFSFEEIWNQYPNKVGRKAAERSFRASVQNDKDFEDVKTALKIYGQSENVKKGFVQNGSTWFNNWRDWITNPVKAPGQFRRPKVFTKNLNCACCHGTGINPDIPSKPNCQFCWS